MTDFMCLLRASSTSRAFICYMVHMLYTQCIHIIYMLYTQCIHMLYMLYTQCIHVIYVIHTVYTYVIKLYVRHTVYNICYICCTYGIHSERHSGTCNITLASTGPHTTNTSEQFSDLPHWLVCYTHCNFLTWMWGGDGRRRRERRVRGNKGGIQDHPAVHGVHTNCEKTFGVTSPKQEVSGVQKT